MDVLHPQQEGILDEPVALPNLVSDLVSIYLTDYEKIRDEIRMRIAQRHQFTNYSLVIFAAMTSLIGALVESKPNAASTSVPFLELSSELVLLLLVSPSMFYCLLFMYLRHDFYIVHMTVFLEEHIGKELRKIIDNNPDITGLVDSSYLLGWEKLVQEIRQAGRSSRTYVLTATILDVVTKHTPFLLPVLIFIGISCPSILYGEYHFVIYAVFWIDIAGFLIVSAYVYVSQRSLMSVRSLENS